MPLNKTRRYSRHTYGDNGSLGKRNICSVSFVATDLGRPAAASTTKILALSPSSASVVTTYSGSQLAQPDVPRNLTVTPGGTTADVATCDITITGKNVEGKTITETFAFLANATAATVGALAFASVTSVSIPAQDGGAATFKVGTGAKLGIGMRNIASMPISVLTRSAAGVEAVEAASASVLSATTVEANTVTTTTGLDGAVGFRVYVLNYKFAANPTNATPDYGV